MAYVITELRIDGLRPPAPDEEHPEATPLGPFTTREDAWNYAHAVQRRFGNGGGSVSVVLLTAPREDW